MLMLNNQHFQALDEYNQDEKTKKIFRDLTERHNINTEGLEMKGKLTATNWHTATNRPNFIFNGYIII